MENRQLILFVVLSVLVLLGWEAWQGPAQRPVPEAPQGPAQGTGQQGERQGLRETAG
ncbi:MAG: membrane protein insertase YidC, partial [Gammaproteobacteria bacterium]